MYTGIYAVLCLLGGVVAVVAIGLMLDYLRKRKLA